MSEINKCTRVTISGGQDPQTLDVSALISSTGANSSVEASYCVNGGTAQGVVNTPASGAVSGLPYNQSISGLNAGDSVDIKVLANVATMVGTTGSLCLSGSVSQTDASGCMIAATIDEMCCDWTAVGSGGGSSPDCSQIPTSINCDDLPITLSVPNATSISASPALLDYSISGFTISANTAGTGVSETVTITATNGNAAQNCSVQITINGCGMAPTNGTQTISNLSKFSDSSDFLNPNSILYCGIECGETPTGDPVNYGTCPAGQEFCNIGITRFMMDTLTGNETLYIGLASIPASPITLTFPSGGTIIIPAGFTGSASGSGGGFPVGGTNIVTDITNASTSTGASIDIDWSC